MKNLIHISILLIGFLVTTRLYSQSTHQCFALEQTNEEIQEKIWVSVIITSNEVEAEIDKIMIREGVDYSISWEMHGTMDGNKIVFILPEGAVEFYKKDYNPIPGPSAIENWVLKDGQLLMNQQLLNPGECK